MAQTGADTALTQFDMKNLLFSIVFLFSAALSAQDTIRYTYSLDTFGIDSFFLVETVNSPILGLPRGNEATTPYYFTDTAQFNTFINLLKGDSANIEQQFKSLSDYRYAWSYKISRLECLRDSVFLGLSCSGLIGSRMVTAPQPVEEMQPEYGYWIIYTSGKRAYIPPDQEPASNGTILNKDGTTTRYRKLKNVKL